MSRCGRGAQGRRVSALGAAAGTGLALGVGPFAAAPAARADFEDLTVAPVLDQDGPALADAAAVDPPALAASDWIGVLMILVRDASYEPIYALGQAWIASPFGQLLDPVINAPTAMLLGRDLIGNGEDFFHRSQNLAAGRLGAVRRRRNRRDRRGRRIGRVDR